VIHEVNGNTVKSLNDFTALASSIKKNSEVVLLIERGDTKVYLAFVVR
jgi:hypothetical protein